jgi:hypothetical protein
MKRRKWSSEQKLKIVLEGLSGQIKISKLCNKYQISQALYYCWRDQLLSHGHQAFETKNITKKEQHLGLVLPGDCILDWYTKKIVGYSLSLQSKSKDWQETLHQAVNHCFPKGIRENREKQLYPVSDNGCQPTSLSYMKACSDLSIKRFLPVGPIPREMPILKG